MRALPIPVEWRDRARFVQAASVPDDWFAAEELAVAAAFPLPKRRSEWRLSRAAAKELAVDLGLCRSPRECVVVSGAAVAGNQPRLSIAGRESAWHVSISHSGDYAAAAISVSPVGVDVERVREIGPGAVHLFLTPSEAEQAAGCRLPYALLHFWAAKEAAWKQREGAIETLKQVPLKLEAETAAGLRFDGVETVVLGQTLAALTLPTS